MGLVNSQLAGLYKGYSAARQEMSSTEKVTESPLSEQDILFLNLGGDLEDLEGLNGNCSVAAESSPPVGSPVFDKGRCSALLRLTENNGDQANSENLIRGWQAQIRG